MGAAAGRADRRAWFHGRGAARNLASAGHNVVVFDLDLRRVEDLARTGARPASSGERPAAQVDVLFTSLSGPRQSAATIPGLIDALPSRAIWIDMTILIATSWLSSRRAPGAQGLPRSMRRSPARSTPHEQAT
ncbi:MAG: hypothetical protein JOY89_08310 [Solirubrobacterales bacterium]|nr:hypothetical protein [Solirubrobacterales bacterium]